MDGQTITINYLSADGQGERFPALAAEWLRLKADIVVVTTTPAAKAAKHATSTIPIVMIPLGDPVGTGLVASLARPGGNVTGLTFISTRWSSTASSRTRLEQLCRYLLRPAVAQDRLRLLADGRIVLTLKNAWADGTRYLVFEPLELLEKLAALTPRPRINLVLYHGVLAPHAGWRARVVAYGVTPVAVPVPASPSAKVSASDDTATTPNPRHWAWADLMRRAFDIDVLACPRCGGRMRLIATIEDPDAIRAILAALARSRERADRAPPSAASVDTSHAATISA